MAQSPDGNQVVTGAGDETLRFWKLGYSEKSNKKDNNSQGFLSAKILR